MLLLFRDDFGRRYVSDTTMITMQTHSTSVSSATPVGPTPATAIQALAAPEIWASNQFWPMCSFLFSVHGPGPVWTQMRPESFRQLIGHLHRRIERNPDEVELDLVKNLYFVAIRTVRGAKTNQQMHGAESAEFLKFLYETYKYLIARTSMPLFGDMPV